MHMQGNPLTQQHLLRQKVVQLWTQMLEASQRRDERIISNVQTMQVE